MLHRRNLVVRNFKVEIDFKKYFFWFFFEFWVCFWIFVDFWTKACSNAQVCGFTFYVLLEFWNLVLCSLNLILTFQCIPDCDKLLINLIMSCFFFWRCDVLQKENGANVLSKMLFSECYFLFLKLKGGAGFAKRNNLF